MNLVLQKNLNIQTSPDMTLISGLNGNFPKPTRRAAIPTSTASKAPPSPDTREFLGQGNSLGRLTHGAVTDLLFQALSRNQILICSLRRVACSAAVSDLALLRTWAIFSLALKQAQHGVYIPLRQHSRTLRITLDACT